MSNRIWIIAGALTGTIILVVFGMSFYAKQHELDGAKSELNDARSALAKRQQETGDLNNKLAESQTRIEQLQQEKAAALQSNKSLEQEMRSALQSKDVTISKLQGKLTVNILDRILFDSGEAELKPEGADVLRKVAAILVQHPGLKIHVIGHTDDVPIRASLRKRFPSNWELSTARATAAVRFLTEQGGVDPHRLGAVGYGEYRPVADNSTPEGRAKNRRIAITILSEEMAGADTVPTVNTNLVLTQTVVLVDTNSPASTNATAATTNSTPDQSAPQPAPEQNLTPPATVLTNAPAAK